ncbi:PLP-dependent aminotransferase family protein [Pseudomonas entomophila]|uniref:MocR-like pyridoxine biosynthesis transcription factor PdxR n=1 Tax=Pseudomonas entomophila TaxID=312306 RepID=UPI0023D812BB|nr:PLP-dependent aminotransferase family protein [Pseudomonas entomophila]MDF0730980.1 PLP-dependent aminotransferase family protein [Pseudomonas entomophila]
MARGKQAIALDIALPVALSAGSGGKHQVLHEFLQALVVSGHLPPGSLLPSTRTLATRWGVARGTLEAVFEQLKLEGYIERRQGAGSQVAARLPDQLIAAGDPAIACAVPPVPAPVDAQALEAQVQARVPFVARLPDPDLLEPSHFHARLDGAALLAGASTQGNPPLRQAIAAHLKVYRGIDCTPDDIVITHGIRHTLDLFSRILDRQRAVAVEDPGYAWARRIFTQGGHELVYIPIDSEGLRVDALAGHPHVGAVHVTPAHQAPLGLCLGVERRQALLAWAQAQDAYIVEDDYDSEYNYASAPLPALRAIDTDDRVLFCGSFNKTLFSHLRLGFAVVPRRLREAWLACLALSGQAPGVLGQHALQRMLDNGHYARHLRVARQTYQRRRDLLLARLRQHLAVRISGEQAGLHFILWLPEGACERRFCLLARRNGLMLQPVGLFTHEHAWPPGVLIGYASLSDAQIVVAAGRLVNAYRQVLAELG